MGRGLTYPIKVLRARRRSRRARALHEAEVTRGAAHEARADRTPILITGSPRSGTTLLYQLLTEGLDVGWLANAHTVEPSDAAGIERRERPRTARAASDFESEHGTTRQPWGPSEAEGYWYRFFPREPHQVEAGEFSDAQIAAVRAGVREFADACGTSVVFKNVFNSLRIPVIAAALPEARYVHIERDLEANARSLLVGRVKRGDLRSWWSARPSGSEAVADASPGTQVAWQVAQMNRVADREFAKLPEAHVLRVAYDEVCTDPRGVLTRIHEWLLASGADVRLRPEASLPEAFDVRAGGMLEPELEADLQAGVALAASGATREDAPA